MTLYGCLALLLGVLFVAAWLGVLYETFWRPR
jgi:hypothetical protein